MKYIDAEKLKKIINNLYTETCISEEATGFYDAIDKTCDVIDSLQQEQQEVDLKKEIERYTEEIIHLPITNKRTPMDIMESDWVRCAHHFYKLGLNARREE